MTNIGFFIALLTVLFTGLKLTGYIDWSWFMVIAPVTAPLIIVGSIVLICGFISIICKAIDRYCEIIENKGDLK